MWQGSFTALGCGTLKYFEIENELTSGHYPNDGSDEPDKAAQFYIVEADASGSVRVRGYDLITHSFFDNVDYFFKTPADKSTFAYTYADRMKASEAPQFDADAKVTVTKSEAGEYFVSFPAAKCDEIIHDYKIKVTDSTGMVSYYSQSELSGYYYLPMPTSYNINIGSLDIPDGCKVSVTASSAYAKLSNTITAEITV